MRLYNGFTLYSVGCYYISFLGIARTFKYDVIKHSARFLLTRGSAWKLIKILITKLITSLTQNSL